MNTPQFKITARSAWDTVEIGPFNTRAEAEQSCNESEWPHSLIKEIKPRPVEFETLEVSQEPPQKQYAPLREIMVYYKNGGKDNAPFSQGVSMAAHLTDKEMLDYFAPGAVFNVGAGEFDLMAEVERAEIIR